MDAYSIHKLPFLSRMYICIYTKSYFTLLSGFFLSDKNWIFCKLLDWIVLDSVKYAKLNHLNQANLEFLYEGQKQRFPEKAVPAQQCSVLQKYQPSRSDSGRGKRGRGWWGKRWLSASLFYIMNKPYVVFRSFKVSCDQTYNLS